MQANVSLGHVPSEEKWSFDTSVTACFDDMLARSIPQYEVMRLACFDLGKRYVKPNTAIVDLGCSRGEAIAPFVSEFGVLNAYTLVEVSEPMREAASQRFQGFAQAGALSVLNLDLRRSYPRVAASLVLSVLTIQFTPIEYRQRIIQNVYDNLIPGGAFLFVEKILGADSQLDSLFVSTYYDLKRHNGYTQDEIDRKKLSLEGVLVPVSAKWNEDMLRDAGFRHIDCFWRWMNFAGWIAVKS